MTLTIEEVTDVFIRINSQGVVLSQADFAMSKISSDSLYDGTNIRKQLIILPSMGKTYGS